MSEMYNKYNNRKRISNILLRRHSFKEGVIVVEYNFDGFMMNYDGIFCCDNFIEEGVDNVC